MAIEADEKPRYYNIVYKKVGKIPNSQGAGALGADTNGILIHTFTNDFILLNYTLMMCMPFLRYLDL